MTQSDNRVAQADKEYEEWQKKQSTRKQLLVHLLRKSNHNHGWHGRFTPTTNVAKDIDSGKFVTNSKGKVDFGEITAEIAASIHRQAASIRLRQGNDDEGLMHINREKRLKELKSIGYSDGVEAVEDVSEHFDAIYQGKRGNLLLVKRRTPNAVVYVQLTPSEHGDYYDVKTATPSRQDAFNNKTPLWERAQSNQNLSVPSVRDLSSQSGVSAVSDKIPPQNDLGKSIQHLPTLLKSRTLHGRIDFNGLPIGIETGRSRMREWHNPQDGSQGISRMTLPYGYFKGTLATDGDAVDVFVGPDHHADKVYVVHTTKAPDFADYDEDKCIIGVSTPEEAVRTFHASYSEPRFFGSMSIWPFEEFREALTTMRGKKLQSGDQYIPPTESDNGIKAGPGRLFREDELRDRAQRTIKEASIKAGRPITAEELLAAARRGTPQELKKSGEAMCKQLGDSMGIDWKRYNLNEFCDGMLEEQEHADVVDHDDTKIAKIVLVHLDEDPHYYSKMAEVKKMGLLKARAGIRY